MLNINIILEREKIKQEIITILSSFDSNNTNVLFKKGIYIYGSPGCGKTEFVMDILKEMNYDAIKYDAGDVRNKLLIDTITCNNMSSCNVLQLMKGVTKKIAIVMDEIDGMNNGDKGGITSLIKIIRQKKTKKQKLENKTMNPIICIGNYYIDKKIKELIKVCNTFELKSPTSSQIPKLIELFLPDIKNPIIQKEIEKYVQFDLRKILFIQKIYKKKPELLSSHNNECSPDSVCTPIKSVSDPPIKPFSIQNIFHAKSYNEDTKKITQKLINFPVNMKDHNLFMNETDRTIVALLWHENIVDTLTKTKIEDALPFYLNILENTCFADYTDRITFQNQIWQFNEMSSLIKTFHNNKIYHDTFPQNKNKFHPSEVRFTKVLTKYSTEYNNILFIYNLTQELDMDKKDLIAFFQELRIIYGNEYYNQLELFNNIEKIFENYNISKLDIKRIYRYLDKNVNKDAVINDLDEIDDF
jgi:hypothetical protein